MSTDRSLVRGASIDACILGIARGENGAFAESLCESKSNESKSNKQQKDGVDHGDQKKDGPPRWLASNPAQEAEVA